MHILTYYLSNQVNSQVCLCSLFQSYFFDRDDVDLPGFAKFFKQSSDEEREHAQIFMKFQNQRGGRIVLQAIQVQFIRAITCE